ncbi:TetR/AcrR family transcriptional regulator [Maricaulis sp.]|uniref:TetR/AcrR family transcriptional regulator n=1 Tax=Maricaulis sp. TaxID=1486257 RepID=UPI002638867A|nr:TetR/AcrR family transcriptional regulator [Maricaulis sp.]
MDRAGTAEKILDVAESLARHGGYGGFSFRDLASAVGIKSASVHYHFPTKEALGVAMTQRYNDRFLDSLGDPRDSRSVAEKRQAFIAGFRAALVEENLMCLCGVLGAESASLPQPVAAAARGFFERTRDWLLEALETDPALGDAKAREVAALELVARLEGAMIMAQSLQDVSVFDRVAASG